MTPLLDRSVSGDVSRSEPLLMVDNSHTGAKQRSEALHLQVLVLSTNLRDILIPILTLDRLSPQQFHVGAGNGTNMPKSAELRNHRVSGLAALPARP